MGIFLKSKEERQTIYEKNLIFRGNIQDSVGKIPFNSLVDLKLDPDNKCLSINYKDIHITLPYERINYFKIENEVTLKKAGSGIGGAIVGGLVAGGVGALVGANTKKGATNSKWIAILDYNDKEGTNKQLAFIDIFKGATKSMPSSMFEKTFNQALSNQADDITEL